MRGYVSTGVKEEKDLTQRAQRKKIRKKKQRKRNQDGGKKEEPKKEEPKKEGFLTRRTPFGMTWWWGRSLREGRARKVGREGVSLLGPPGSRRYRAICEMAQ